MIVVVVNQVKSYHLELEKMRPKIEILDLELDEKTGHQLELRKKYLDNYEDVIFKSLGLPSSMFDGQEESITKNNKNR